MNAFTNMHARGDCKITLGKIAPFIYPDNFVFLEKNQHKI